jgi:hypothetical protein
MKKTIRAGNFVNLWIMIKIEEIKLKNKAAAKANIPFTFGGQTLFHETGLLPQR